jgi:hypothetical protein
MGLTVDNNAITITNSNGTEKFTSNNGIVRVIEDYTKTGTIGQLPANAEFSLPNNFLYFDAATDLIVAKTKITSNPYSFSSNITGKWIPNKMPIILSRSSSETVVFSSWVDTENRRLWIDCTKWGDASYYIYLTGGIYPTQNKVPITQSSVSPAIGFEIQLTWLRAGNY